MKDNIIEFLRKKDYKLIKNIGQGGTGKTILIEDETIGEHFVCKKYSPYFKEHKDTYYGHFVLEIKLLHLLYHRNVVRVFNYYLYPEKTTGYILMEYVDGLTVRDYLKENPERLDDIFIQTISGFLHLEENEILHRDIRPENILVSNLGIVKIIDFGFGKKIEFDNDLINSVSLNWRYKIPKDFEIKTYDHRTEIYFVGKLFEEIIVENDFRNFSFPSILNSMIKFEYSERLGSFFDVERKIIEGDSSGISFGYNERLMYQKFAEELNTVISKIEAKAEYNKDLEIVISKLEEIYRSCLLEDFVQNPVVICRCFIRGEYYFNKSKNIFHVSTLKNFVQFLKASSLDKKRVIINNIWQRLDSIDRYSKHVEDDLPF